MRLVSVIGMHRSGTSLVARITNLLGVELGPPEELLPAAPRNPTGFWENARLVELNDELLDVLGGNATTPPPLPDGWELRPELGPLRERATRLVRSTFDGAALAGWKDPRASLTLPFWRSVAPLEWTIHCLRHPVETALSFKRWHELDGERVAKLWLRYVVAGCRADPTQLLVRFDDVHADPVGVARRIATFLGLPPPQPEAIEEIRLFVDPRLRHFNEPQEAEEGPAALAAMLYRLLSEGGLERAAPLSELLHRSWVAEHDVAEARRTIERLAFDLDELAKAERALRNRRVVRLALRLRGG